MKSLNVLTPRNYSEVMCDRVCVNGSPAMRSSVFQVNEYDQMIMISRPASKIILQEPRAHINDINM